MFFLYAASVAKIGFSERSVCVFLALLASRGLLFVVCLVFGGLKWSLIGAKWAQCLFSFRCCAHIPVGSGFLGLILVARGIVFDVF